MVLFMHIFFYPKEHKYYVSIKVFPILFLVNVFDGFFFIVRQIVIKGSRIITVKENVDQKTFKDLDGSEYHHFLLKLGYIMDLDRNCPITVQKNFSFFFI